MPIRQSVCSGSTVCLGSEPEPVDLREPHGFHVEFGQFGQLVTAEDGFHGVPGGALAFEALSRGAARAFLVEKSRVVARAIEKSARELGLSDRATVIQADLLAGRGQSRWLASIEPASLVFFDPPYAEIAAVEALLSTLAAEDKLRPGAAVVIEHARRAPPTLPPSFGEVRSYRYGDTAVLVAAWESE